MPFYLPMWCVPAADGLAEVEELEELYVDAARLCKTPTDSRTDFQLGIDLALLHYLVPFALRVLDIQCYAVELKGPIEIRGSPWRQQLLPQKLLRLRDPHHQPSLNLMDMAMRTAKRTAACIRDNIRNNGLEDTQLEAIIRRVFLQMQGLITSTKDLTMEAIAKEVTQVQQHPLYEDAALMERMVHTYVPPEVDCNVRTLAQLKAEIEHSGCIKTLIVLNAANCAEPARDHVELFRYLYHSNSEYLQEAFPPRVIVHVANAVVSGDQCSIKAKYTAIFATFSLWDTGVDFAESVQQVMDKMLKPISSKATNHPLFEGSGSDNCSCPEFEDTLAPKGGDTEHSLWPAPPIHPMAESHISGCQDDIVQRLGQRPGRFGSVFSHIV